MNISERPEDWRYLYNRYHVLLTILVLATFVLGSRD